MNGVGGGEELGEQNLPPAAPGRRGEPARPRCAEPRAPPPAPGPDAQWQTGPHLQGRGGGGRHQAGQEAVGSSRLG